MTEPAPDPRTVQRILEHRARLLARAPEPEEDQTSSPLLVVVLGPERYGIDLHLIQEIQPFKELVPVPGAPPHWAGVVNLRGRLFPVLHCRRYLLADESPLGSAGHLVVVGEPGRAVALLVDDAVEVRQLAAGDLRPPLADVPVDMRKAVTGVTSDLVAVLDLRAILADLQMGEDEPANA